MMLYIGLGLLGGALSGLMGVGGGIILVPALVYFFGFSQHEAQGTTLALMVPPIGLFAAWKYYENGHVDLSIALFLAIGFILGSIIGSYFSLSIPNKVLSTIFGGLLICIGTHLVLKNTMG